MVRKGGEAAEFVYGLSISSLEPSGRLEDEEDMPLRFVSVQLQLPDSSKNFDIDVHAFLFEEDGTYLDCVFYKNPTLAGKSVRLLQQEQELLVDLRYIPRRCSFIVCTLAIYSGGTVAQLGNGTVQLSALVPRVGLDEGVQFPQLPCGQLPSDSSDLYEWVCLGVLPLKARSSHGEECGMMLCLLAHHAGFWYFKPVLKPVTAFTPQGLIEPAQDFVTRQVTGMSSQHHGVELGALLNAAREGTYVEFELTDTEGSATQAVVGPGEEPGSDTGSWVGSRQEAEEAVAHRGIGPGGRRGGRSRLRTTGDEGGDTTWGGGAQLPTLWGTGDGVVTQEDAEWRTSSSAEGAVGKATRAALTDQGTSSSTSLQVSPYYVASHGEGRGQTGITAAENGRADQTLEALDSLDLGERDKFAKAGDARRPKSAKGGSREAIGMGQRGKEFQRDVLKGQRAKSRRNGSPVREGVPRGSRRLHWESIDSDQWTQETGAVKAKSLFTAYPPDEGYQAEESYRRNVGDVQLLGHAVEARSPCTRAWKDSIERRLAALEYSVDSIRSDIRTVAAATTEMQQNNKLYIQELREKFTELKDDVAADIESALAGPLEALNFRVDKVEANEAADAKQLAEQQQKLWAVDRTVVLAERNWHLIAQSLSELRFQLAGFEQRIVHAAPTQRTVVPLTDQEKGLPVSLQPFGATDAPRSSKELAVAEPVKNTMDNAKGTPDSKEQGVFATKALTELSRMQHHAEAFGACLRQLASGTAPDGLKGLNPIERRVLSFAGTPKVFAALHELERAVDAINLHGSGATGTRLY